VNVFRAGFFIIGVLATWHIRSLNKAMENIFPRLTCLFLKDTFSLLSHPLVI